MNYIIVPKNYRDKLIDEFSIRTREERGNGCYYEDIKTRGEFSVLMYTDVYLTLDYAEKVISAVYPELKITMDDNRLIADSVLPTIHMGDHTGVNQGEWWLSVEKALKGAVNDKPYTVELNSSDMYLERYMPTLMLTPYNQWYNQGRPASKNGIEIIFKNSKPKFVFCPNTFDGSRLKVVRENPSKHAVMPTCVVRKNEYGYGNTVIFTQNAYSEVVDAQYPSIFSLMTDTPFWEQYIFRLLYTPFWEQYIFRLLYTPIDVLQEEIKHYEIPESHQIRMFTIARQEKLRSEISALENSKISYQNDIESYFRDITSHKVQIKTWEDDIRFKMKERASKTSVKAITEELKTLKALPFVENYAFSMDGFTVNIAPCQILDGPILGPYKISYSNSEHKVKIWNEGNPQICKYSTRNSSVGTVIAHPHIPQGGSPCFGNYNDMYYRFEVGEFVIATTMMRQYLQSYNPDDEWGRRILYWDAVWGFEDIKQRDLLDRCEEGWSELYRDVYGRALYPKICRHCSLEIGGPEGDRCECERCDHCQEHLDDCCCNFCEICGEVVEECGCDRCPRCGALIDDCECLRCTECNELRDTYFTDHCVCLRCPEDEDVFVDVDGVCGDCEHTGCEHHPEHEEDPF